MSEQLQRPPTPYHFAMLPTQHNEQLAAIADQVSVGESSTITDHVRRLVAFSTVRPPTGCSTPYDGDPAAYVDTAVTVYREAATSYPAQTGWQFDESLPGSPQSMLLKEIEAAADGPFRQEYSYLQHRVRSQLSGSNNALLPYFSNTLRAVADAARTGADAAYFRSVQGIAGEYLDAVSTIANSPRRPIERRRATDGAYVKAVQKKTDLDHHAQLPEFWNLPADDQLDIARAAGNACLTVVRYADNYGASDRLAQLVKPRLVRPATELVTAMGPLSDIGRRMALQAFLDEGAEGASPSFPEALQAIPEEYKEADAQREQRALTLEALWTADIGDEIIISEEDVPLTRKQFDAEIDNIIEGTAERLHAQQPSRKPRRNYMWESKIAQVADRLLESSHARILNLRVCRLDPAEAAVDDVLPENIRYYHIAVDVKSSGRPAVTTAIKAVVYCREADRHIEMRRSTRGRVTGAAALALQQEYARQNPHGRQLVLAHGLRRLMTQRGR